MQEIIDGLPNIFISEDTLRDHTANDTPCYLPGSNIAFEKTNASFGIALHMHQPTIPASSPDIEKAALICNLQHMMEHQDSGDNHNAPVFLWCYSRMSDFVRELETQGKNPRVMLDYSGNLLWGLRQMGKGDVLDNLKLVTSDPHFYPSVEWLGTMWSHAVVSSTPVPDIKFHLRAWQSHFASIFGFDALKRVRGFSPPEMHLPIHPDVCYEYVKALKECGYQWLMVQEHTVENVDGSGIHRPHFPHRLVAKNSAGEVQEITVLIKTQGSDTKLVAQMQPYYEAKTRQREEYAGKNLIPHVLQIGDGENGGVMMNEFPPAFKIAFNEIGTEGVVALNGSEYLEYVKSLGIKEDDFTPVQPIHQHRIWNEIDHYSSGSADRAIDKIKETDSNFNLDKGSWTSDKDWVKGYENVLTPMSQLSVTFHQTFDNKRVDENDPHYKKALLHLLLSQTSCFRYWGQGLWTDYAHEIIRRGMEFLQK